MRTKNLLILFTRNPELGKVKSRLAKSIGEEKALLIYKELLQHTRNISGNIEADKRVYYSENIAVLDEWDTEVYEKKLQQGKDLGEKMLHAFKEGFTSGYENIIIIGSDIYDLQEAHIKQAFKELKQYDSVVGPAEDGGYYLLGMKTLISSVFENKNWGTESVLKDTLVDLDKNHTISFLDMLNDIDLVSDIKADSYLATFL